jgi:signal transduction histidine kinase
VDRIESIVEDLLARARDTFAPTEPVDLAEVLERARLERWAELAGDRGRVLTVHVEPRLPPAKASPIVVHQVLDVLVTNALDHGAGEVLVLAREAADGLVVEVADHGPGFDEAALRTAFVRNNPAAAGHGIGLALARELAEAVGGRLVVLRAAPAPVVALVLPGWREPDREDAAPYSADDPR